MFMQKIKNNLLIKLNHFIRKYYLNELIRGGIWFISILTSFFIFLSIIEYYYQFDINVRTTLFWVYIILFSTVLLKFIFIPILKLVQIGSVLTHKEAAKIIGKHFPEIEDKLLNYLELSEMNNNQNELINASIEQKISLITPFSFNKAVDISKNKKQVKWIIAPIVIILLFYISGKEYVLTESSNRIIKHNTFFEPEAPFEYAFNSLSAVQYSDHNLIINTKGRELPKSVVIEINKSSFELNPLPNNNFSYKFKSVESDVSFFLTSMGYKKGPFVLRVQKMPKIINLEIELNYPEYTQLKNQKVLNKGDITIAEGTEVSWNIKTRNSDNINMLFDSTLIKNKIENNSFRYTQTVLADKNYKIIVNNKNLLSDTVSNYITIIKDQYPEITYQQLYDSINLKHLFYGNISDDYKLSKLTFIYKVDSSKEYSSELIQINQLNEEAFFFEYNFNELNLNPGQKVVYNFSVWDNDKINGHKKTTSNSLTYSEMTSSNLIAKKDEQNEKTKNNISASMSLAEEIKKDIDLFKKLMLENKTLGWKEKKLAKKILDNQKKHADQIQKTQKQNSQI